MTDKDEMIQVILTLHRDGSVDKSIYVEPGIAPAMTGLLTRGLLAHAQESLRVEVVT